MPGCLLRNTITYIWLESSLQGWRRIDWQCSVQLRIVTLTNSPVLSLGATFFHRYNNRCVHFLSVSNIYIRNLRFSKFFFFKKFKKLLWGFIPSVFCVIESQFSPHLRSILNSNNSSLFLMTKYANLARVDSREIILKFQLQNVKWKFNQYQQQHSVGVSALSERDKE